MSFTIPTPEQIESMNEHELKKTLRATIRKLKQQDIYLERRNKDIDSMIKQEKAREKILIPAIKALSKIEPVFGWNLRDALI